MKKLIFVLCISLLAAGATYVPPFHVDDSDLAGPAPIRKSEVLVNLAPDQMTRKELFNDQGLSLQFLYERNGVLIPISNLNIKVGLSSATTDSEGMAEISQCKGQPLVEASLSSSKFQIQNNRSEIYKINFQVECAAIYQILFNEKSNVGEAMSIFETLSLAEQKLKSVLGKDIWSKNLKVTWPSNGDYYNFMGLNITVGYQWDVVGHELGHAIYDMGKLGAWGGGQHKIDECYSNGMAISEGWATFFASWLYNDLSDSDAKFQYLVPRRAPIRIEHVPEDVCNAPQSEWRVSSFLWDLIDKNVDNEGVDAAFALTWNALENSNVSSIEKSRALFERVGISKELIDQAWTNNFSK